jgi:hypothetical protein
MRRNFNAKNNRKKVYDTNTALMIGEDWNGLSDNDFRRLNEELYKTKKGKYFLFGSGGPLTKYGKSSGNQTFGSSQIIPMSEQEAYRWLEEHGETEAIEEFFPDEFEEA